MINTMDADDAWCPPTLRAEGFARTRFAWWVIADDNQSTLLSTSRRTPKSSWVPGGVVTGLLMTDQLLRSAADPETRAESAPSPAQGNKVDTEGDPVDFVDSEWTDHRVRDPMRGGWGNSARGPARTAATHPYLLNQSQASSRVLGSQHTGMRPDIPALIS